MNGHQVLGYLSRNDKWFLGGGKMVIWSPEFPVWLDKPGYWDHACYLDYRVGPLFTLAVVDQMGREVELQMRERFWQPDHSSQLYENRSRDLIVTERRALLPWDVLVSTFEFANRLNRDQTYDLVVWTAQDTEVRGESLAEIENLKVRADDGVLMWQRRIYDTKIVSQSSSTSDTDTIRVALDNATMMRFNVAIGANLRPASYGVRISDRQPNLPRWKYTPFYEKLAQHGGLGNQVPNEWEGNNNGLVYCGLHYKLTVPAGSRASLTVYASIGGSEEISLTGIQSARRSDAFAKAAQDNPKTAQDEPIPDAANLGAASPLLAKSFHAEPVALRASEREQRPTWPAKRHWSQYFESMPDFACSDPYIMKYYWYRYYGLRLNTINANDKRLGLNHPCVFEGINLGWFRQHITYSAQCHMLEARWLHDPALAQGSLLNFIDNQHEDGSFPGVIKNIYAGNRELTNNVAFYHANWGMAVRELHRVHPDKAFLEKIYRPLVRYARYFDEARDPEKSGLYDVLNHWETGQEFMSRYQQIDATSDQGGDLRLKGLDATIYLYTLQNNLAWMSAELGQPTEAQFWNDKADRTRRAVLGLCWDGEREFFYDVNPANFKRLSAKSAIGFYPFMAGIAGTEHLGAITRHLLNPQEFWTPYPVPSTSADDPTYSSEGEWNERRLVCPWNGRTWLMTNSHVAEALCRASLELDPGLQPKAVEFLQKFIKMLFLDGNVEQPSSYEYYNPVTGQAPFFRGTEDYMHSWISDLIIKYVAGVQPGDNGQVRIQPLPFDLDYFTLDRVKVAGHWLKITWRKDGAAPGEMGQPNPAPVGLAVWVDGKLAEQRLNLSQPIDIKL